MPNLSTDIINLINLKETDRHWRTIFP